MQTLIEQFNLMSSLSRYFVHNQRVRNSGRKKRIWIAVGIQYECKWCFAVGSVQVAWRDDLSHTEITRTKFLQFFVTVLLIKKESHVVLMEFSTYSSPSINCIQCTSLNHSSFEHATDSNDFDGLYSCLFWCGCSQNQIHDVAGRNNSTLPYYTFVLDHSRISLVNILLMDFTIWIGADRNSTSFDFWSDFR